MKLQGIAVTLGVAVLGVLQQASAASALSYNNLLANPSFETPTTPAGGGLGFSGGQTIGAWTVVGNDVVLLNTTYQEDGTVTFNAEDGNNSVDLTGSGNSGPTNGVTQTVSTPIGTLAALTFYVGRASGNANYPGSATINLQINGGELIPFTNSNVSANSVNWQQYTYNFAPTTASTTITFLNGTNTTNGTTGSIFAGLDNVSLQAVAVPFEFSPLQGIAIGAPLFLGLRLLTKRKILKVNRL